MDTADMLRASHDTLASPWHIRSARTDALGRAALAMFEDNDREYSKQMEIYNFLDVEHATALEGGSKSKRNKRKRSKSESPRRRKKLEPSKPKPPKSKLVSEEERQYIWAETGRDAYFV